MSEPARMSTAKALGLVGCTLLVWARWGRRAMRDALSFVVTEWRRDHRG